MKQGIANYYERYWSPEGWQSESHDARFPERLKDIIARRVTPESSVLDAGCGDGGKYGTWLAGICGEYQGVDIAETAVAIARERGLSASRISNMSELPFADDRFDVCVCIEVLEHLVFPLEGASELRRVLRPGGTLIVSVPNTVYWRRRIDLALLGRWHPLGNPDGARRPWDDAHLRFFTRKTLERMLTEAGFETTVLGIGGSLFGDLPWIARRFGTETLSKPFTILETAMPSLFGANLAAVARKAGGDG